MNFAELTNYLDSLKETYGIPSLDCKILKDHQEIYRHQAGYADYEETQPVTENQLYRLYSATKLTTMTAVLQLAEQNKIDLYCPVAEYLPEFQYMKVADEFNWDRFPYQIPDSSAKCHLAHRQIRIIDLMTMTAGMHYNTAAKELLEIREKQYKTASTRDVVRKMAEFPLVAEPGTHWMYGFEHDVLAAVVEAVTGMMYGSYLRKYILEPAGSEDTGFHLDHEREKRVCALYMMDPDTKQVVRCTENLRELFKFTSGYESGGAGLISTVDSYSRVMDALCNGGTTGNGNRVLSEKSVQLMSTNYLTGAMKQDFLVSGKRAYGYGLGVQVRMDDEFGKEFGWDGAAGAYILLNSTHHLCVMYAQHVMRYPVSYSEIHPKIRQLVYKGLFDK